MRAVPGRGVCAAGVPLDLADGLLLGRRTYQAFLVGRAAAGLRLVQRAITPAGLAGLEYVVVAAAPLADYHGGSHDRELDARAPAGPSIV